MINLLPHLNPMPSRAHTIMKPLSKTYKELGIAFGFPIEIKNALGDHTYYENSSGVQRGTPKSSKTCEGKVVEVDGIKYKLKAL